MSFPVSRSSHWVLYKLDIEVLLTKASGYKDLRSITHWVTGLVKVTGAQVARKFCGGYLVNALKLSLYVVKMICGIIMTPYHIHTLNAFCALHC
jgi:hypothetical protein